MLDELLEFEEWDEYDPDEDEPIFFDFLFFLFKNFIYINILLNVLK